MIHPSFFDEPLNRRETRCIKWDVACRENADCVPMWVADMDFRSPDCVVNALKARAAHPTYGYTGVKSDDRTAMIDYYRRRHGMIMEEKQILMLPGVITGMRVCLHALTEKGDGVILQPPVYGPFRESIEKTGRKVMKAPLHWENGHYTMDLEAVRAALKAGARMMFLCNPHNPVGRAWHQEEIEALHALLSSFGAYLVSDEIHADFVYAPRTHYSALRLPDEKIVVLLAASKTFNLAGLQQASLVCRDAGMMAGFEEEMAAHGTIAGNVFALEATREAYLHGDEWLDALKAYLAENIRVAQAFIARNMPHAILSPMEATYLGWLDLRAVEEKTETWMHACEKHGVMFTSGTFFGEEGEGFLRLNLACPREQMLEGLRRLQAAYEELSGEA